MNILYGEIKSNYLFGKRDETLPKTSILSTLNLCSITIAKRERTYTSIPISFSIFR